MSRRSLLVLGRRKLGVSGFNHPSPSIPLPGGGRGRHVASGFDNSATLHRRHSFAQSDYLPRTIAVPSPLNGERVRVRGGIALPAFCSLMLCIAIITHLPSMLPAATFTENFSGDPAANGWQIFGSTNLFHWDSTNQNLRVTWDSSQTNSYFYRLLGTILTSDDDFSLSFNLTFEDYASGTTPGKPFAAPATIGFLNLDQATHTNFARGAGINPAYGPRNLVEFNFFPSFDVFLPTIGQVIVSTNNSWLYNTDNLMEMTPSQTFSIRMDYVALTRTLTTVVTNRGAQYGQTQTITVPLDFDFRVATLSVSSYSDVRDMGSILAHGTVDNLVVVTPPVAVQNVSGGFVGTQWQVQFTSRTNWQYHLERATDFAVWSVVGHPALGNSSVLTLVDPNPQSESAFYRVRASRP